MTSKLFDIQVVSLIETGVLGEEQVLFRPVKFERPGSHASRAIPEAYHTSHVPNILSTHCLSSPGK